MISIIRKIINKIRTFKVPSLLIVVGWFALVFMIIFAKESWVWDSIKDAWDTAPDYVREVTI